MIDNAISLQRQVKDNDEIACIKSAQKITDKAFLEILNFIKAGVTEKEISAQLEFLLKKFGADTLAFETIAISGKNTALPHGVPTDKAICEGDFFTLDFGAKVSEYCSDMTRTVAVKRVDDEQIQAYNTVLLAQHEALKAIKSVVDCRLIDQISRNITVQDVGHN